MDDATDADDQRAAETMPAEGDERILELADMSYEHAAATAAAFDRLRAELTDLRTVGDAQADYATQLLVSLPGVPEVGSPRSRLAAWVDQWRSVRGDARTGGQSPADSVLTAIDRAITDLTGQPQIGAAYARAFVKRLAEYGVRVAPDVDTAPRLHDLDDVLRENGIDPARVDEPAGDSPVDALRVAAGNLYDALDMADVEEHYNPPTASEIRDYMADVQRAIRATAVDTAAPAMRSTGPSRDERVDRLTAAVENVCDVAAIEVEVHELDTGPTGWQRSGVTSPLRRLVRALEGAGMLDADDLNGGPPDDTAAPGESIEELRAELALRRSGIAAAPPCTDGYWRNERHPPPPSATSGENADPREDT